MEPKSYYERNLPHWHPPGATFFLTYRLYGSIAQSTLRDLRAITDQERAAIEHVCQDPHLPVSEIQRLQKRYFAAYDAALDANPNGPYWLQVPEVAQEVFNSLLFIGKEEAEIHAFTIMSNHVHVLLTHRAEQRPLFRLLQSHKSYTAHCCNKHLRRTGHFWQDETYDHVVRPNGEFERILAYILQNPVKARLVERWEDWRYTYLNPHVPRSSRPGSV